MGLLKNILANYVPVNWVTGEVITADKLNRSEQGIVDLNNTIQWYDTVPISEFSSSIFEKGGYLYTEKDSYRENVRIRSKSFLYSLNGIDIGRKADHPAAVFLVTIFDNEKNIISTSDWVTSYRIPANSIFTIILTSTNNPTSDVLSVDEIYNRFDSAPIQYKVVENTRDHCTAKVGDFNSETDIYEPFYSNRACILEFISCDNKLIKCLVEDGYKIYINGYDKDFNLLKFNILGTGNWLTGLNYIDVSDYKYIRIVIANSADTSITAAQALENVELIKSVPDVENYTAMTIDSLSKDGINQEQKSYAPLYPQSSIVSFQKAFDQGFRSLILHIQFTADSEIVVFHDVTINNNAVNTDGSAISETLRVDQLTLSQLDSYDFGLKFGEKYAGTKITRFEDALDFAKKHNMYVQLEPTLRLSNANITSVCDMLKKFGYIKNICYFSSTYADLAYMHNILPGADLALGVSTASDILSWSTTYAGLKGSNRLFFYQNLLSDFTDEVVADLTSKGIEGMTQDYLGDEPDNLVDIIDSNPFITRIVSQIIPANLAMLE